MKKYFRFPILLLAGATLAILSFCAADKSFAEVEKSPPYEERLLRLSEIMGSIHFLSLLCQPDDGMIWHEEMTNILNAEATTQLRRAKLIERFNAGFSAFQATYRHCTPVAATALNRYQLEAKIIVQNLTTDFSG